MAKKKNKPTGLAISRSGLNFTLTWTPMKGSKKQDLKFYVKTKKCSAKDNKSKKGWTLLWGGKSGQTIDATTKSKKCSLNASLYKPNTKTGVYSVVFVLKGSVKAGKWSSEVQKEYILAEPGRPSYEEPTPYNNQAYTYTYSWGRNSKDSNNSKIHFNSFEWQTILITSDVTSGKKLPDSKWKAVKTQKITTINTTTGQTQTNQNSYGTGSSVTIVDSPNVLANNRRRFVRVRARGAAGYSDWQYCDHPFGVPDKPYINNAYIVSQDETGISGSVQFKAPMTNNKPVDSLSIEYAILAPRTEVYTDEDGWLRTNVVVPPNFPESSWIKYRELGTTNKQNTLAFHIPDHIPENNALFFRAVSTHDEETQLSTPFMVLPEDGRALLTEPVLSDVEINTTNHRVQLTVLNNTELENNKSFVAVYFRTDSSQEPEKPIGVIPYGTQSSTFVIPEFSAEDEVSIGVQTFVADRFPATYSGELTYFDIDDISMASSSIKWDDSAVPHPPEITQVSKGVKDGTIKVMWDWPWEEANSAELSWSDDPEAWMSTNGPSTYVVNNLYSGEWNISGLAAGVWYIKVRLLKSTEESLIYGTYSETAKFNLSSAPNTPTLTLEPNVVAVDGTVNAYWEYEPTDGTNQLQAELALAEFDENTEQWSYTPLEGAVTNTANHIEFAPSTYEWEEGSDHYVSLSVTSGSHMVSDWSTPVQLSVANAPVVTVTLGNSFETVTIPIGDNGSDGTRSDFSLVKFPITFTVSGAGVGGITTAVITRADDFDLPRPDDSTDVGQSGETILYVTNQNDTDSAEFSIEADDPGIVGHLDDEAPYILEIVVTDTYGQTAYADPILFYVHWEHQAVIPRATVEFDYGNEVALITPQLPTGASEHEGDYCQIYRLSADRPQLIVTRAEFGETYVDPFPTFGMFSGYRVVYFTKYGDYRDADGNLTWIDYEPTAEDPEFAIDLYNKFAVQIDFDGGSVVLPGNVSLSNSWKKDFQVTKYLGGSVEGDWKPGVDRTGSYKAVIPVMYDMETAYQLRILADYPDACHIRTPEGSNFYGNVDINEDRSEKWINKTASISLSVTKVDNVSDDGMLYSEWLVTED